jgi:TfoX/Sxy family transcriptional regulator of competence genes
MISSWRGILFGILNDERLYLKVDEQSEVDIGSRGIVPSRPTECQTSIDLE